jgi:hypothetical protein
MHQPSFRGVVAALSRRLPRPGLGIAIFGARLLVAFGFPPLVFPHEAHSAAPPATAVAVDEAPFWKENEAAMIKMMDDMAIKPTGDIEDAPPLHKGPWPIRNGRNYQPTEHELRASHEEDVTPGQAREIDRLYDQLLAHSALGH